jgi:uncharacterized protein YkwD
MPGTGSRHVRLPVLLPRTGAGALGALAFWLPVIGPPIGPPPASAHRAIHRTHPRGHRAKAAGCENASRPAAALSVADARYAVVCLINKQRTERGLPALAESAKLDRSAQSWTDHMVAAADFSHGVSFSARIAAAGYSWQMAGENIATGQDTPQEVVAAWMASTGHCQNILQPEFRDVGAGVSTKVVPGWNSDPVTWTTDFGLSATETAASHDMGPANGCPYG